ncbi:MAG: hypothetical protein WCB31_00600 [Nitrososphaeraceae archaeon]
MRNYFKPDISRKVIISLQPILAEWKMPDIISTNNYVSYLNYRVGYAIECPDNWNKVESEYNATFYPSLQEKELN